MTTRPAGDGGAVRRGPVAARSLKSRFNNTMGALVALMVIDLAALAAGGRVAVAVVVGAGLVGAFLVARLAHGLHDAVAQLKEGAERLGAGDLAHEVKVGDCADLHEVGESLNAMAARVRQARDELQVRNDELAHLAFKDPLTRLANRALFRDRLLEELVVRGRSPADVAVLFIDLDNFKGVNDTLGHSAGDQLLVGVAARLLDASRGSDTVARLGGDEFAILLHRVRGPHDALVVAERVIASLASPFELEGRTVVAGASIGVARGEQGDTADDLLRNADLAMYRAKSRGKGRYEVYQPAFRAEVIERMELEADLREAVGRGDLTVVYHPIVRLADGFPMGFEALVRWTHPTRGVISPLTFIPVAEQAGLIEALGRHVLNEACRAAAGWQAGSAVAVSVNVSGRQLESPRFVDDVVDALAHARLSPRQLILEITETVVMQDDAAAVDRLGELRQLGTRLAIDDFGTGYSSLAYLQRFPVDILKIDRAFIQSVTRGGSDAALARTIIGLGATLDLQTVAEGIENAAQLTQLRSLGCDMGQGYYFAEPLAASDVARYLARGRRQPTPIPGIPAHG